MRTCEPCACGGQLAHRRWRSHGLAPAGHGEHGFSYLLLLFMVLISGVALARLGSNIGVAQQREREAELLWRGAEIRRALESYHAVPVNGRSRYPEALADLVEDSRLAEPRYHLRRLYLDPYTGRADWLLKRDAEGGIVAVHSRSRQPALARVGTPAVAEPLPAESNAIDTLPVVRVGDWHFAAAAFEAAPAASTAPGGTPQRVANPSPRSPR